MLQDIFWAALERTVEYQEFQKHGFWNANTLSAIGVVITSCMEMWGLWQQGRTIRKMRSAESVSVTLFNYTTWYFMVCGTYGAYINSASAFFSGLTTGLIQIPILIALLKFKKFRRWEGILAAILPLMPIIMMTVPERWQGITFLVFSSGGAFIWGMQPFELWSTKTPGAVDIRLFGVYFVTTLVWMVFVISVGDIPLIVNQTVATIMITLTIVMWTWYWQKERARKISAKGPA